MLGRGQLNFRRFLEESKKIMKILEFRIFKRCHQILGFLGGVATL